MEQLEGKVAVVTGAASGIGLGMATRFAAEGMKVVLADVERAALDEAALVLEKDGADVLAVPCDVSDGDQVDALAEAARAEFGSVHVVCNNAGVGGGGQMHVLSTQDWEWVLGVNLWGVIHGIRAFLPGLLEQGEGHIVNTASMAGLVAPPGMGPYNATKYAVVAISETLHGELQMSGTDVGVSVLCPGWVNTRIHESDRNRPDALRNAVEREVTDDNEGMRSMISSFIATGMNPADVAGRVVDAIRTKDLYILTHPEMAEGIRNRFQRILDHLPGA